MTAETTSAASDAAGDELLWPEEVAALIGWGRVDTVKQRLAQARRHGRQRTRTGYDMPEPVPDPDSDDPSGRWRREVTGGRYGKVVVNSNRWRKGDILAWQERVRNRPPATRTRKPETGQFTEKP